ncbi:MAG: glycosyltransferase family 2 protein [Salinivirgaceae bacterium]|nr:glycosyltransferase family 2 protein [Salinivirgaceae bacterium]
MVATLTILFWTLIGLAVYAYVIYPLLIAAIARLKRAKPQPQLPESLPHVTLFVTAFNEEQFVDEKIANSHALDYPADRLHLVWVTDGSDDNTNQLLAKYPDVKVFFEPERRGKVHAMKRGLQLIDTDIVIFTDANTMLSAESVKEMVRLFENPRIGCVAGEKRICSDSRQNAASSGEGAYWRYESWIKRNDATAGSAIGAAGELFAMRRSLYQPISDNTLLDDFEISLRIALTGYKIGYSPRACAIERPSANIGEEMKRKVRIAAGSFQTMLRLGSLFNLFRHPMLTFQYVSHKVLRWIVVPLAMVLIIPLNIYLCTINNFSISNIYTWTLAAQALFYVASFIGFALQNKKLNASWIYIPYYFFLANKAMWLGFCRFCRNTQSVNWERAKRAS